MTSSNPPTDTRTLKPFLENTSILNHFNYIVTDAGYGSEENYLYITDELGKVALIPYGMQRKEQTRKYKKSPNNMNNWQYDELADVFTKPDGVKYIFKNYSIRNDKYGFTRYLKIYEADKIQATIALEQLAKTPTGRQKQILYNPTWQHCKANVNTKLQEKLGQRLYAQRKIDVETVFGRMKRDFVMRRVHVRGKQAVTTELGFVLMSMNLTKLVKQFRLISLYFILKSKKILVIFKSFLSMTKIMSILYLGASFFPAPLFLSYLLTKLVIKCYNINVFEFLIFKTSN